MKRIFVTGGAGYIGSHTVLALLEAGYETTVFDNLEFGSKAALERIEGMTGKKIEFIKGDMRNTDDLDTALNDSFDGIIHFAAYKNVSDSIKDPSSYYVNNVMGMLNLLNAMRKKNLTKVVFSSSCSVHGQPKNLPVKEDDELAPISPYARTKLACEYMCDDFQNYGIDSIRLRYFNAAGAHPSGKIGEDPNTLLNVIPRIFGKVLGTHDFKMFGNGFDTPDGTQIRDYIHVMDLADGHIKALEYMDNHPGSHVFGLGTGRGTSLLELIDEIEKLTDTKIEYEVIDPIKGDPVEVYGDASKAEKELGWKAQYDYKDILRDAWKWYQTISNE